MHLIFALLLCALRHTVSHCCNRPESIHFYKMLFSPHNTQWPQVTNYDRWCVQPKTRADIKNDTQKKIK